MADITRLGFDQVQAEGLDDWVHLRNTLVALFRTKDFAQGLGLVNRIGELAEQANHHPDLSLTYTAVEVTLTSHDAGGLTSRDVDMARRISEVARELGITAEPTSVSKIDLALDVQDVPGRVEFWAAATGWEADGDVVQDADMLHPELWMQRTDSDAADRQRHHLDISIPREQVEQRIERVLKAGGKLVDDRAAPRFWVLEDPEGNRFCFTTPEGRTP